MLRQTRRKCHQRNDRRQRDLLQRALSTGVGLANPTVSSRSARTGEQSPIGELDAAMMAEMREEKCRRLVYRWW
jgi:hypothetical protein